MLRLDRLLDDAGDGSPVERLLAVLQGVRRVGADWESVCPASPAHPGLYIRIEPVFEEHVPIAWCTAGCSDRAVLAALTERLTREAPAAVSGRAEPPTMAVENRARISETKTPAARPSAPLGSEAPCESCSKTIVKTRRSRRFCSDLCRDVFHGRRKAQEAMAAAAEPAHEPAHEPEPRAPSGSRTAAPAARSVER